MTQEQCDRLNGLVGAAIFHGGGKGGPYFTNQDGFAEAADAAALAFGVKWKWIIGETNPEGEMVHYWPSFYL
jgi:hypothetical protein